MSDARSSATRARTTLEFRLFLAPRNWPVALSLGVLWLAGRLPYTAQVKVGRTLGRVMLATMARRRRIARTNLALCFPEVSSSEQATLLRRHFEELGQALLNTGIAWWGSEHEIAALGHIEGLHHLETALQRGKGAILLTGHMTSMDLGGQILALALTATARPLQVMYKRSRNPLFEMQIRRGRERFTRRIFLRDDFRAFMRGLKEGLPTWYAPDQDFGLKHGVFADFFGVPTASLTTTARLAASSGAPVVPYFPIRLPNGRGIAIKIGPALADFPSGDDRTDARRINELIEHAVREHPEQYWWVHRRFKTRPEGLAKVY
ncbi:MAG: LpxL/LpxP family Kdo(2)-lipid IV(A) lauroyl/palmitoleoyl acyltransferase [Thiotrichales bacterium]